MTTPGDPTCTTVDSISSDGVVSSRQSVPLDVPVVQRSESGARELGVSYLAQVERCTKGLVRAQATPDGVGLVAAGLVPLLRLGPPRPAVAAGRVECRFAIEGGLLTARPGGWLAVGQADDPPHLYLEVVGYRARLTSRGERSVWRRVYHGVQARAHTAISRRYLVRAADRRSP